MDPPILTPPIRRVEVAQAQPHDGITQARLQLQADTQARFPIPVANRVISNRQLLAFSQNRRLSNDIIEKIATELRNR
jgi:hypothetical protein